MENKNLLMSSLDAVIGLRTRFFRDFLSSSPCLYSFRKKLCCFLKFRKIIFWAFSFHVVETLIDSFVYLFFLSIDVNSYIEKFIYFLNRKSKFFRKNSSFILNNAFIDSTKGAKNLKLFPSIHSHCFEIFFDTSPDYIKFPFFKFSSLSRYSKNSKSQLPKLTLIQHTL